ncbi:MAG: hypothetical protein M3Y80_00240, partial [Verrucomicrobiota bacterium]|nr:hypothetical protein [Verrucomicrobiota bacterium]
MKKVSLLGFALLIVGVFLLAENGSVFAKSPLLVAVQIAAAALMIWARLTFGMRSFHAAADPTAGGLVTSGPYRFVRHPIYASICLFCTASLLSHRNATTA